MTKSIIISLLLIALPSSYGHGARAQGTRPDEPLPPREAYARASLVFVGTVKAAGMMFAMTRFTPAVGRRYTACIVTRTVTFRVVKSYYGAHGAEEVLLGNAYTAQDFKEGETYLVYAFRDPQGGGLVTSDRMRTRPAAAAEEDFLFLDGEAGSGAGVSLGGTVTRKGRPLAGAKVRLTGGGRTYDARTDARGVYELAGLAPGEYRLRVKLRWDLMAEEAERVLVVSDRGHVREDFVVRSRILWLR